MEKTNAHTIKTLSRIYRIVEAGEKGFSTAAANANNKSIKILLKSFAQQRAVFKSEIIAEIRRYSGDILPRSSFLGAVHRGRAAIFAAMTIEDDQRERVVLKEAAFGERFAARAYQKALEEDLPSETHDLIERQYAEVRKVIVEVLLMAGKDGKRMLAGLFDTDLKASSTVQALMSIGIPPEGIHKIPVDPAADTYTGSGTTVMETFLSGIFGGTVWGMLIGFLAAVGVVQGAIPEPVGMPHTIGLGILVACTTILLAALIGGIIGLVIGKGISEDDTSMYQNSIHHGAYLVKAIVASAQVAETKRVMSSAVDSGKDQLNPDAVAG